MQGKARPKTPLSKELWIRIRCFLNGRCSKICETGLIRQYQLKASIFGMEFFVIFLKLCTNFKEKIFNKKIMCFEIYYAFWIPRFRLRIRNFFTGRIRIHIFFNAHSPHCFSQMHLSTCLAAAIQFVQTALKQFLFAKSILKQKKMLRANYETARKSK